MATSHLKQAIKDLKARILSASEFRYCAVFNNQIKDEIAGKTFNFPKPAVLIEIQAPTQGVQLLGTGVTVNDFAIRFSIVHEQLNAEYDGNSGTGMDENLDVFDLRDKLKTILTGFQPTHCSNLQYSDESPDYDHNMIYVYGITLKCSYVDTKGSGFDVDSEIWQTINPPINLDLQGYITTLPTPPTGGQVYGWKVCKIIAYLVAEPDPLHTQQLANGDIIPVEYAANEDGTITIPELISYPGIDVLTPFTVDNVVCPVTLNTDSDSVDYGKITIEAGFIIGNYIEFNASLPLYSIAP